MSEAPDVSVPLLRLTLGIVLRMTWVERGGEGESHSEIAGKWRSMSRCVIEFQWT
jgi:hypothetical protein